LAESLIIGREEELALLEQRMSALVDGGTAAVLLEGEPGIGKTTLFRSAVSSALKRGYHVLSCHPSASEVRLAYAGLGDLLERVESDAIAALPPPQRQALEIALRLRDVSATPPDPRTIALAFRNVLRELSAAQPLIVAIDDAQWIDSPSAAVVEFAARRLESEPLLLLIASRRESHHEPSLDLDGAGFDGRLTHLEIPPLGIDELHLLVHRRFGRALPRPELKRLREASGGNPFYALELARALPREGDVRGAAAPLPLPETLRQLVDWRLDALPAPVRRIVELAAAVSEPTVALLAAASAGDDEISTAIEAAVAASVIELDGEKVRFAHPLLAASAYSRMAPPRRRRLHRKLASLVDDPEARARHLALGADGPREDIAAAAEEAARLAAARGAPWAAAELCEEAIVLTPPGQRDTLQARQLALVRYHVTSGDQQRARAILGRLRDETPSGPVRAGVLLLLARLEYDRDIKLKLFEEAKADAAGDTKLLSSIHQARGETLSALGDARRALRDLRKALALADECADQSAVRAAITSLVMVEPSTAQRTPGLFERALSLDPGTDDPSLTYNLQAALALVRLYQGHLNEARSLSETLLAEAAALGDEPGGMNALRILSLVEFRAGNWHRAAQEATQACELMVQLLGRKVPVPMHAKALIEAHLGRVEEATKTANEGIAISEELGLFHGRIYHTALLGLIELALGHADAADRFFRPLIDELTNSGWAIELHFPSGEPIDALIAIGEHDLARDLLDRFEREGKVLGSPWIAAAADRCRGLLLASEGDLAGAAAALAAALVAQEGNGWPFEQARTLLALGQTQRRAMHRRVARESLLTALALFEELGARLWARQTRAELVRIGGRAAASAELTPTEQRVAALVAQGRTNKETAAALYLSPHTIEGHLSRIYAKLGIRSRTELAHRLARETARARHSH
jgi:DNA-binding CsgD family transcriptional regulator